MYQRREFLKKVVALSSVTLFAALSSIGSGETHQKADKDLVHYRLVGCNEMRNCMNCRFFETGKAAGCMGMMEASCKVVTGSVSPMGYCDIFAPR